MAKFRERLLAEWEGSFRIPPNESLDTVERTGHHREEKVRQDVRKNRQEKGRHVTK